MAARGGVSSLPANTIIEDTHKLANFLEPIHKKIKEEVVYSKVLPVDETPHRMLEGDDMSNLYQWGFSTDRASFFEAHDTRFGNVAIEIIKDSNGNYCLKEPASSTIYDESYH